MFKKVINEDMLNDCFMIRKKVFVKEQNVPEENEIDKYEELSYHVIGYTKDGDPFATARFRPLNTKLGKVERVAITKENRGLGYSKLLMKSIEEIAKDLDFDKLTMHAQTQAQAFYEKIGYKAIGETFIEENIEHVRMNKSI